MQEINREGLTKAIGVANFYSDRLMDLIEHNGEAGGQPDRDPPLFPAHR
jgi:diketogulonate reductase-like aldo/keto reductase